MSARAKQEKGVLFQLSGYGLALYTLPLPAGAFVTCVVLSLLYNFEESTRTHCGVPNYLPSISASIGGFTPQRYIWRICIALHCAPRFMLAIMHYNYYKSFTPRKRVGLYNLLVPILGLLHIAENAGLVVLSFVSSSENYKIHESSFISFMVFSELYMILTLVLFKMSRSGIPMDDRDLKSFRWKLIFFLVNIGSFAVAIYFFWRHNTFCEEGMYTGFALCEYIIVTSNIAFNGLNIFQDFGGDVVFTATLPLHKVKQMRTLPV